MHGLLKTAMGAVVALGLAGTANADGLKDPKDVKIAFVVHGSASDPYWSVVKAGVDAAAKLTGAQVQYISPQVFDEVEHARLIDAAVATKPDGIIVSIADADAMRGPVTRALAAGIPVMNVDSGEIPGEEMGVTFYVGTVSEYDSGKRAGTILGKDGILKVVCINHEVGNTSLDDRCRGLNDGLAPFGGIPQGHQTLRDLGAAVLVFLPELTPGPGADDRHPAVSLGQEPHRGRHVPETGEVHGVGLGRARDQLGPGGRQQDHRPPVVLPARHFERAVRDVEAERHVTAQFATEQRFGQPGRQRQRCFERRDRVDPTAERRGGGGGGRRPDDVDGDDG
ncbi:MAG: substrate-binding domain-containing protein, partial [Bauldia sp.]